MAHAWMLSALFLCATAAAHAAQPVPGNRLRIEGTSTCPRPAEVAARLADHPPASADAPPRVGRIDWQDGNVLVLELWDDRGQRLASRELRVAASCETLADAAAVIFRSLDGEVRSGWAGSPALVSEPKRR